MSTERPPRRILPLLGFFVLLACATAALWLACAVVVPSAQTLVGSNQADVPGVFGAAFGIQTACFICVTPIAIAGVVLFLIALIGKGPVRMVAGCHAALGFLAGAVACLSLYLLVSGGIILRVAAVDRLNEIHFYKHTLDQFALLQAAEGRYQKIEEDLQKSRDVKMIEAHSVSEFSKEDAKIRISAIVGALAHTTDPAQKKQFLATLCLFRDNIRMDSMEVSDIPRIAADVGAPATKSPADTFDWIAANLHKDGWDQLPLFKIGK